MTDEYSDWIEALGDGWAVEHNYAAGMYLMRHSSGAWFQVTECDLMRSVPDYAMVADALNDAVGRGCTDQLVVQVDHEIIRGEVATYTASEVSP